MLPEKNRLPIKKRLVSDSKNLSFFPFFKSIFFCFFLILALSFGLFLGMSRSKIKDISRVNFILKNKNSLLLVSLGNPENKDKAFLIRLPQEKKIQLTRGFGEYPLGSIYSLGELEGKGEALLLESLQNYFGLPLDGYFFAPEYDASFSNKAEVGQFLSNSLFKKIKSDFSFSDRLRLSRRLAFFSEADFISFDLSQEKFLNQEGQFDLPQIDSFLEKYLVDNKLSSENLALAVYNAADLSGLAGQAARLLVNSGGRVVTIGNANLRENILIRANRQALNSYTFKKIRRFFPGADWEEGEVEGGRADLAVYLGKAYWKMLTEKW